jgi:hypothetical protein
MIVIAAKLVYWKKISIEGLVIISRVSRGGLFEERDRGEESEGGGREKRINDLINIKLLLY